jgi:hypothetical protein
MKLSISIRALCLMTVLGALPLQPAKAAHANTPGNLGLGIVLGEPSGLSAKYWLHSRDALDFGLAYSFNSFFAIFSDYLYHFTGAFSAQKAPISQITPYVGIGAIFFTDTGNSKTSRYFSTTNSVGLGVRIPLGLEWRPASAPLGIFLELVPGMGIIPATFGFVEGGIGARFYF